MKGCSYNSPDYIAMYVDGVLSPEEKEAFERHLYSCDECLQSVMNLLDDLTTIKQFAYRLKNSIKIYMLFNLVNGVLKLIDSSGNIRLKSGFNGSKARGDNPAPGYEANLGSIALNISGSPYKDRFSIILKGVRNCSIELRKKDRLLEVKRSIQKDEYKIDGLFRGEYILLVKSEKRPNSPEYFESSIDIRVN